MESPQPIKSPEAEPHEVAQTAVVVSESMPSEGVALPMQGKTATIAVVGFILAFLFPIVGLVVSIVAWVKTSKHKQKGKGLAISGTIIGAILIPVQVIAGSLLFLAWMLSGGFHGNDAQTAMQPIMSQLQQLGAQKLCDNGDSGHGIDNRVPWYEVYYQLKDDGKVTDTVKTISAGQGFNLHDNTEFIKQLKGVPDEHGNTMTPYGEEEFNPKSDYLVAKNGGKTLIVTVNRDTSVKLYCSEGDYGAERSTGPNAVIINATLELPDVE